MGIYYDKKTHRKYRVTGFPPWEGKKSSATGEVSRLGFGAALKIFEEGTTPYDFIKVTFSGAHLKNAIGRATTSFIKKLNPDVNNLKRIADELRRTSTEQLSDYDRASARIELLKKAESISTSALDEVGDVEGMKTLYKIYAKGRPDWRKYRLEKYLKKQKNS